MVADELGCGLLVWEDGAKCAEKRNCFEERLCASRYLAYHREAAYTLDTPVRHAVLGMETLRSAARSTTREEREPLCPAAVQHRAAYAAGRV